MRCEYICVCTARGESGGDRVTKNICKYIDKTCVCVCV